MANAEARFNNYCFTSTETIRLVRTETPGHHLDFHTAPELCQSVFNYSYRYLSCLIVEWVDEFSGGMHGNRKLQESNIMLKKKNYRHESFTEFCKSVFWSFHLQLYRAHLVSDEPQ